VALRRLTVVAAAFATAAACDLMSPSALPPYAQPPIISTGPAEVVLVGAGDIGVCAAEAPGKTARLLDARGGTIFTTGDHAYPSGTAQQFRDCYEPTWGRHKQRTRPSPGNHDYETAGGAPYFTYFGANAGPAGVGYYHYRLGAWDVYALNSNVATDAASPQVRWLQDQLTANGSRCALAYWHHPLFTSGPHGDNVSVRPLWQALYDAGAEIVLAGHDHLYERFAPQDHDGRADPVRGIRQFIVGTGGAALYDAVRIRANSEVRWRDHGVLELILRPESYSWTFLTGDGAPSDLGIGSCH
jgi:acid phosphatase type 7